MTPSLACLANGVRCDLDDNLDDKTAGKACCTSTWSKIGTDTGKGHSSAERC